MQCEGKTVLLLGRQAGLSLARVCQNFVATRQGWRLATELTGRRARILPIYAARFYGAVTELSLVL